MARLFVEDMNDWGFNVQPALDQGEKDIREALRLAIKRKRENSDPDYFQKQLDGVLPPKAIISPEHYHLSYVYEGHTYPYTARKFTRRRNAYWELWRLASLSYGEPIFWEDTGGVTITTSIKGRTGMHQIYVHTVECLLSNCNRDGVALVPVSADQPTEGQDYDREIGPVTKKVENSVETPKPAGVQVVVR